MVREKIEKEKTASKQSQEEGTSLACSRFVYIVCYLADQIVSGLLIGPLTAVAWLGIWSFLERYLFPERPDLSGFVCFALGNIGLIILALIQGLLIKWLPVDNFWCWLFGCHLYTCVLVFFNVCHWRGLWVLLDYYTGINPLSAWTTYGIGQCFLWMFKASKNAQTPPMIVICDNDPEFYSFSTRFRLQPAISPLYVLDVTFTVVIIHQLVVFYWRGLWKIMDLYLFPDDVELSAFCSLAIAFVLTALTCVVQLSCNYLYERFLAEGTHPNFWAWLLEVISYFFSNVVNVALWRGVWLVGDRYLVGLFDDPDVSYGLFIAVGLGVLMVMFCGHSVTTRGCELDGEPNEGAAICSSRNLYIRSFLYSKRKNATKETDCSK